VNIRVRSVLFVSLFVATATLAAPVSLRVGAATIELTDGTVFPQTPTEAVFIGHGVIRVKPDDPIEAGQLELFTAKRELDEPFTEAIFVAASAETMATLTKGAPAASSPQAQKIYDAWKGGTERKLLSVDSRLLAAASADADADKFFAARLHGTRLGDFDYVVDPVDRVTVLGQWVAEKLTEREKRRAAGRLEKEHRRGRSLGTEISDLGTFNVWSQFAAAPQSDQGDFEPELYHIDVTVAAGAERLGGRTTIDLKAVRGHRRVVPLRLHEDLKVSQVTDAAGTALKFVRTGDELAVVLPAPAEEGQRLSVTVAFEGVMFEKEGRAFRLRNTELWYPHAGSIDRARYDVTLHWPADLEIGRASCRERV